jgi:hypothetical protein
MLRGMRRAKRRCDVAGKQEAVDGLADIRLAQWAMDEGAMEESEWPDRW